MKKLLKKVTAIFMAAVISASALIIPSTTASAAGIFDGAVKMEAMEYYNVNLPTANEKKLYKITTTREGKLTFRFGECTYGDNLVLYDASSNIVMEHKNMSQGWRGNPQNWELITDTLKKGTYYLSIWHSSEDEAYFKDLYYSFTPSEKPTLSLKATIKKGTKLQLGSITENYDGKVTWVSTKKSVATVSSKGLVTAKKTGNTTIRAQLDNGEYIQIKIYVKTKV